MNAFWKEQEGVGRDGRCGADNSISAGNSCSFATHHRRQAGSGFRSESCIATSYPLSRDGNIIMSPRSSRIRGEDCDQTDLF
jgi:hypothetical protein